MKTVIFRLPAPWASYLINGDASGLSADELSTIGRTLVRLGVGAGNCLDMQDEETFSEFHDAWNEQPLAGATADFTFSS